MLDDGAGQARRLEAVLRDASTTRATCMVAAAASFCQLVEDADLHLTGALCRQRAQGNATHRRSWNCRSFRYRNFSIVIPGWSRRVGALRRPMTGSGPDLRCAIAHRGIQRFRVRVFDAPRNDKTAS